jgi:FAD dependent oxidoreductase TIGR03364
MELGSRNNQYSSRPLSVLSLQQNDYSEMSERIAIVGAGIFGIAHAWHEARNGAQVTLFERHWHAHGASPRNFGMIWPVGQPNGRLHELALRSRELWSEFLAETGFWGDPCGSLHVACRADELEVLQEFSDLAPSLGYDCQLIRPDEIERRCRAVKTSAALGALWSPTEMCVNSRDVIRRAPEFLRDRYGVTLEFGTLVNRIEMPRLTAADGREWHFDRVTVVGGADCKELYPEMLVQAGLRKCKLQMMRTAAQPNGWRMGALLAGGLTLRHYSNFQVCSSLAKLCERVAAESPQLDRYGIHVLASQNDTGGVIIGDSHEYGDDITPFDKEVINDLVLTELHRFMNLPDWSISERWHGLYVKLPDAVQSVSQPSLGVTVVLSTSGTGMTMAFGLAEELVRKRNQA